MVFPGFTVSIWLFQRQSFIFPVLSVIVALATRAWFPYLVITCFGWEISRIFALRFIFFIPVLRSLICRVWGSIFF